MSYIGNSPGVASQRVTTTITATAGQTQFTTLSGYILGYVDVYLNGAKLINGVDFEAITGTYITLLTAAVVDDVVELVSYVPRGLTDGYTKAEADAKFLDTAGDTATGTVTLPTLNLTNALGTQYGGTGKTSAPAAMANLIGFTTTVTAAGTTTLTNTSSYYQLFTGSTTQTVVLPVTSTLQTGWSFHICNNSTGALTINSSGGNLLISVPAGVTVMCTCIGTTVTTAADWEAGYTDFSTLTGTFGSVVLSGGPALTSPSITNPIATGIMQLNGSADSLSNFHTTQTTGVMTIGGTAGTGNITVGRSTVSQQTDIQAGATASGSTKTINIGTAGLSGSTTAVQIGSAVSGATSTTTVNGGLVLAGTVTAGGGVGTSGQFLQSTSTGVQWATASGGGASATITISNKIAAYTVVAGDLGTVINCTSGTFTVSLTAAATLLSGFNVTIWNTGTGDITVDPAASETIDGVDTLILRRGEGMQVICNGTNWETGDKKTMRGYAERVATGSTRPIASGGGSVAIGAYTQSTNEGSVAIGGNTAQGTGAIASGWAAIAIGARSGGATASGHHAIAIGAAGAGSTSATSANSCAIGSNSGNTASVAVTGAGAMSLGGSYASGIDSFTAGGANNTSTYGATGANCITIGQQSRASSGGSVALGSSANASGYGSFAVTQSAVASGLYAVALGNQAAATAAYSFAVGSVTHIWPPTASASNSFAFGAGANATHNGKLVISGGDLIAASTYQNGLQAGTQVLRGQTIDATAKVLVSDTDLTAAGVGNQVVLPNNSAYAFSGIIVARRQAAGGTQSAAWRVEGLIRREGTAASTVLVASAINTISNVPGWTLALTTDTTNGALAITTTGAAATNIRWVATIQTSEVTYA